MLSNTILDLAYIEKINVDSYDIWHQKVQFALEEVEILKALNYKMTRLDLINHQARRDIDAYNFWRRMNTVAQVIMLFSV